MKFSTRAHTRAVLAVGVLLCSGATLLAAAEYPTKAIRVLVGFAPGGSADIIARAVGQKLAEAFIAATKASPGKFSYASAGSGSPPHLVAELFKLKTGAQLLHVPYKGTGAALPDVVAGQVQMMVDGPPPFLPHVKAGKLKALAAASEKRNPLLPDVPTFAEAGVTGMEAGLWYGIVAPKGTPRPIVAKLNAEINRALGEADLRERFAAMSVEILGGPPDAFARYMAAESKRWGEVVRAANIRVE